MEEEGVRVRRMTFKEWINWKREHYGRWLYFIFTGYVVYIDSEEGLRRRLAIKGLTQTVKE